MFDSHRAINVESYIARMSVALGWAISSTANIMVGRVAREKPVAARSWSCSTLLKPQSHRVYDQVTTYLRPENVGIVGKT